MELAICLAVIAVIHHAYYKRVLHSAHEILGEEYRGEKVESATLLEAFEALAKVPHNQWGKVCGFSAREVINQIAYQIIRRATKSALNLVARANDGLKATGMVPISAILGAKDNFVLQDITLATAIFNTKGIWLAPQTLRNYLDVLEKYQGLMGFNQDIDRFCRRLRAITKPQPQKQAPRVLTEAERQDPAHAGDLNLAESSRVAAERIETIPTTIDVGASQVIEAGRSVAQGTMLGDALAKVATVALEQVDVELDSEPAVVETKTEGEEAKS